MVRRAVVGLVVAAMAVMSGAAGAVPKDPAIAVRGSWSNLPCVPTELQPRTDLRASGSCTAVGSFGGGWTGTFTVRVTRAEINLVTGTARGESSVTFVGNDTSVFFPPQPGTLELKQVFAVDGTTGGYDGYAVITGGTGRFLGARGCVSFTGFMPGATTATGGYTGVWVSGTARSKQVDACRPLPKLSF